MKDTKSKKSQILIDFEKHEWDVYLAETPEDPKKHSNLLIYGDGEYLLRNNHIGKFLRKIKDSNVPSLPEGPEASFEFALPKIPFSILKQQVAFYRDVMANWNGAEAYSIIFYDLEEKRYFVHIPKQRISGVTVDYDQEDLRQLYPSLRYVEVISAHSHNSMGSFFSGVDDRDEQGDMIYMVMGRLNRDVPSFKIRANVFGKEVKKLQLEEIFDCTYEQWQMLSPGWKDTYDKKWLSMINVVGNYSSPHHYTTNKTTAPVRVDNRPNYHFDLKSFKLPTSGKQISFGSFTGFYDDDDNQDSDARVITSAAIELISNCKRMTPQFAFAAFLETLVEQGYGSEFLEAAQNSSMALYLYDDYDEYFDKDGNLLEENLPSYNWDEIELKEESFLEELYQDYDLGDSDD